MRREVRLTRSSAYSQGPDPSSAGDTYNKVRVSIGARDAMLILRFVRRSGGLPDGATRQMSSSPVATGPRTKYIHLPSADQTGKWQWPPGFGSMKICFALAPVRSATKIGSPAGTPV